MCNNTIYENVIQPQIDSYGFNVALFLTTALAQAMKMGAFGTGIQKNRRTVRKPQPKTINFGV